MGNPIAISTMHVFNHNVLIFVLQKKAEGKLPWYVLWHLY